MGVAIPFSSLGTLVPELLNAMLVPPISSIDHDDRLAYALFVNALQVRYLFVCTIMQIILCNVSGL